MAVREDDREKKIGFDIRIEQGENNLLYYIDMFCLQAVESYIYRYDYHIWYRQGSRD